MLLLEFNTPAPQKEKRKKKKKKPNNLGPRFTNARAGCLAFL